MADTFELRRYRTPDGKVPLSGWLDDLDNVTAGRILVHIDRMKNGNFGNSKSVSEKIFELKINFGPGYRVYYLRDGASIVVLLCGGHKSSQASDIHQAEKYAMDYRRRK